MRSADPNKGLPWLAPIIRHPRIVLPGHRRLSANSKSSSCSAIPKPPSEADLERGPEYETNWHKSEIIGHYQAQIVGIPNTAEWTQSPIRSS